MQTILTIDFVSTASSIFLQMIIIVIINIMSNPIVIIIAPPL